MKRRRFLGVSVIGTAAVLAACGAPAQQTTAPQSTTAPATPVAAPAQNVSAAKPVFIDFYAPW